MYIICCILSLFSALIRRVGALTNFHYYYCGTAGKKRVLLMMAFVCRHVDCYYELYTTSDNRGLVVFVDVLDVTLSCDDDTIQLHVYDGNV